MIAQEAIHRGLDFIESVQLPHGELPTYASPHLEMNEEAVYESSPFVSACVASALDEIRDARAIRITDRVVDFLVGEMEAPGVWRWYTSRHPQQVCHDVDDIVCASIVLKNRHPYIAAGWNHPTLLGRRRADGLFQTWYGRDDADNDVDSVLNANVIRYLGESVETERTCAWLNHLVQHGEVSLSHPYYVSDAPLYYAMARAIEAGANTLRRSTAAAIERMRAMRGTDGLFGNALDTAFCLNALRIHRVSDGAALEALLAAQRDDGAWRGVAAYTVDRREDGRRWYWGSASLTTALAIEALAHA